MYSRSVCTTCLILGNYIFFRFRIFICFLHSGYNSSLNSITLLVFAMETQCSVCHRNWSLKWLFRLDSFWCHAMAHSVASPTTETFSIPSKAVWDLWWRKCRWDSFIFPTTSVRRCHHVSMLHTHLLLHVAVTIRGKVWGLGNFQKRNAF